MDRVIVAKHRKKSIEMNNMKMKYFLVHRWDIIKDKRRQYEVIIS